MPVVDALRSGQVPEIAAFDLRRVRLPLVRSHASAHGVEHERELVIVEAVLPGGSRGWGECPFLHQPGYPVESVESGWSRLRHEIVPAWLEGRRLVAPGAPIASSGVEAAVIDASLRAEHRSLADELGVAAPSVTSCAVLSLAPPGELVEQAGQRLAAGHRMLKAKIVPGDDVDRLRALRDAFGDVALAADANGSYPDVRDVPAELADIGLRYLEQPVASPDSRDIEELARRAGAPVALDESIRSVQDLSRLQDCVSSLVINVKAARLGGIVNAVDVLLEAAGLGIPCFVGGMLETGVGRASALALAAHPACTLPTDLGPSDRYVERDVTPPFVLDPGGTLAVPLGPGIGVELLADELDRVTLERWSSS